MAKKDFKVSINSVDKFLKGLDNSVATIPYYVEDPDDIVMEVRVKNRLTFQEMTEMVRAAANAVFFDVDGEEEYHPEFEEVAKANAILIYVANFKSDMSIARVHDLMYTGILNDILRCWNQDQYNDFLTAFRDCVSHRRDMIVAGERAKLMRLSNQLDKAIASMQGIGSVFDGVDANKLQEAVMNLANMDELSLAEAVVDARDKDFVERRRAELSVVK